MEQFVVLRACKSNVSGWPFMAFLVENDKDLEMRVGKDILVGDCVYAIDHKLLASERLPVYLREVKE
jgi:hypothetical protein